MSDAQILSLETLKSYLVKSKTELGRSELHNNNLQSIIIQSALNCNIQDQLRIVLKILRNLVILQDISLGQMVEDGLLALCKHALNADNTCTITVAQLVHNMCAASFEQFLAVLWEREELQQILGDIAASKQVQVIEPICMLLINLLRNSEKSLISTTIINSVISPILIVSLEDNFEEQVNPILVEFLYLYCFTHKNLEYFLESLTLHQSRTIALHILAFIFKQSNLDDESFSDVYQVQNLQNYLYIIRKMQQMCEMQSNEVEGLLDAVVQMSVALEGEENEEIICELCSQGQLVFSLLGAIFALGPSAKSGDVFDKLVTQLDDKFIQFSAQFPRQKKYEGYKRDAIRALANFAHNRRKVQDDVYQCGGVLILLSQCQLDPENPVAQECALWCIRNLCQDNQLIQQQIQQLQVVEPVQNEEMKQLGLELKINQAGNFELGRKQTGE